MTEARQMDGVAARLREEWKREATGNPGRYVDARVDRLLDALADIPDAQRVIGSALNQAQASNARREKLAKEVA